jgi:hypothetical protein
MNEKKQGLLYAAVGDVVVVVESRVNQTNPSRRCAPARRSDNNRWLVLAIKYIKLI